MPDQVRHDWQELIAFLNYDTVWKTGIQICFAEKAGCLPDAGMTMKLPDRSFKYL